LLWLKENVGVNVSLVACNDVKLYDSDLHAVEHKPRLEIAVEKVYSDLIKNIPSAKELSEHQRYMVLTVGGTTVAEQAAFNMPPVKYYYK